MHISDHADLFVSRSWSCAGLAMGFVLLSMKADSTNPQRFCHFGDNDLESRNDSKFSMVT